MDFGRAIQATGYTPLRTYRLERKCQVEDLSVAQILSIIKLHPKFFYSPYPPRYVNNLYLDTKDLEHYFANVHGYPDRRKVRIRWYGDVFGEISQPVLEIKVKQGAIGMKQAYPLAPLNINESLCDNIIKQTMEKSGLPELISLDIRDMELVLLNRYYRYYYASRDGDFRVTVDTQLSYFKANCAFGNAFLHSQKSYSQVIVEIKYAREQEGSAHRVIAYFPFRMTRSSKYVQGVERVYF
jgi:hypothetical protein